LGDSSTIKLYTAKNVPSEEKTALSDNAAKRWNQEQNWPKGAGKRRGKACRDVGVESAGEP